MTCHRRKALVLLSVLIPLTLSCESSLSCCVDSFVFGGAFVEVHTVDSEGMPLPSVPICVEAGSNAYCEQDPSHVVDTTDAAGSWGTVITVDIQPDVSRSLQVRAWARPTVAGLSGDSASATAVFRAATAVDTVVLHLTVREP